MTKRKLKLLVTLCLLLSTRAIGAEIKPPNWDWTPYSVKPPQYPTWYQEQFLPPKEFDRDYLGALTIKRMIKEDIQRECRLGMKPGRRLALACTRRDYDGPNTCRIWIMPKEEIERLGWSYDIVLRHELGHCSGWHHD